MVHVVLGWVQADTFTPSLRRYDVLIDGESKKSGSIFDDFEPPFNPPAEIDDPEDEKPEDWVDSPKCVHHFQRSALWSPLTFPWASPVDWRRRGSRND